MERVCKKEYLIKKGRRVLAALMCLCMMVVMFPINVKAGENQTDPEISVSGGVYFYVVVGYLVDFVQQTVTVQNIGSVETGELKVKLEGTNADEFELSETTIANIAVGKSASIVVNPKSGCSKGEYTAQIKIENAGGSISESIRVYMNVTGNPPSIIQQPVDASYTKGATAAALTVGAAPGEEGAILSYQWYRTPFTYYSEVGEKKIEGATSASYTPSTAVVGTQRYYCEVSASNSDRVAKSNIVAITVTDGSGTEGGDAGTGGSSGNTSHTNSHKEPTADQGGLEAYASTSCSDYEESVPSSEYSDACNGGANQVVSAESGSELTLDMGVWCAYPKWFMQKIADRKDLTIRIRFEYEHKQYEVIIPAGAAVDTQCDWYGPLKLCSLYAYTVK